MNVGQMIVADVPDLSDEDAMDLVLLRKEYGIGAREAWTVLPAWEVTLLLSAARPVGGGEEFVDEGDPFESPPADLADMLNRKDM